MTVPDFTETEALKMALDAADAKRRRLGPLLGGLDMSADEIENEKTAAENLRLRVAIEKKLPAELIDRLRGGTQEEMAADADKLLELVAPTPSLDGGVRGWTPVPTAEEAHQQFIADVLTGGLR